MKTLFLATAAGVLLAAPFCAQAGQPARSPDPLDPDVPVPALAYDSALRGHVRPGTDVSATPDKTWRRANEAVAGSAGADGQHAEGHGRAAPAPAAPAHVHHHPAAGKQ